ncbi:MAG: PH domain-containing protein [Bacteroidota bacterium]
MDEQIFYCKKDNWVKYLLVGSLGFTVAAVYFLPSEKEIPIWVHLVVWGVIGFVYWIYEGTFTVVLGNSLIQKAGPITWKVPIENIKKIKKQGTHVINHGTWSLDKVDIHHRRGILSISPADKDGLVATLSKKNPNIEVF